MKSKSIISFLSYRAPYFIAGSLLFLLFTLFSYIVARERFAQIDFDTTVKLQNHISRRLDDPFSSFSLLGSVEVSAVIFILIYILSLRKLHRLLIISTFPLFHVFELIGKTIVHHPGPPFMFHRYSFDLTFPSFYVVTNYSYPSGHTGRTFLLCGILAFIIYKSKISNVNKFILYSILAVVALTMLVSRIYLGEHWLSDTIGGAILGLSFALFTAFLW